VLGHPVLYYPAHAAKKSEAIDDWYCSSDDEKILEVADAEGYKRIVRPVELALPTAQHVDCIMHALGVMQEQNNVPDILVVVLANNVTIRSAWITDCVNLMKADPTITAVVPVYEDNDHHPLRAKTLRDDGMLSMYEKGVQGKISTNRQDLPVCYFLSHNFWVLNVNYLLSGQEGQQPWGFMGDKIKPYIIEESIDIHHKIDLVVAKNWIEKNYID
ncbi:MAG: CMP-N-acetylneuraminic acid synthetase, partial [Ruthenibacterium sp.]